LGGIVKLPRRKFLHLAAGAAALPAVSRVARALDYPTRPARIIVGFAAGGGGDIVARLMGQWLSKRLGQQFLIENRPGAGSNPQRSYFRCCRERDAFSDSVKPFVLAASALPKAPGWYPDYLGLRLPRSTYPPASSRSDTP
jgi:hypothetical protein